MKPFFKAVNNWTTIEVNNTWDYNYLLAIPAEIV